ncbi:MAG: cobyrinate a,c-diamide synthase [Hyphomicrobium sp.]|jgi:cobyrinic acid a,c-diamide synthase
MSARPRGLIIAAPSSGAGKTTVVLGLLRALARRGTAVQPFKCGPDYIDTAFHTAAAGRASVNLDTWAMRPQLIAQLLRDAGADADVCIVEGVMGLYDSAGTRGACGDGSTADLAALTGWPVVLVLDVGAQAETAAAVALGLKTYRRDIDVAGVILNMTASPGHAGLIAGPMARIGLPVLGAVQRHADIVMPERHLGLIQAGESTTLDQRLEAIAATVANGVDLDPLVAAARPLVLGADGEAASLPPPGQRIALAQDRAFSFVYAHILAGWRRAGAEIVPFSPLADEAPPAGCDAVWLPGGYPELHAGTLAAATRFRDGMNGAARGLPIHGECGGYMVLGESLVDASGARHAMLGLLGVETSFAAPRMHLGYRRARLRNSGAELVGHEFHFASLLANTDEPLADIRDAAGAPVAERGSRRGSVTGTFFHVIDTAAA